jgi:hypothetical protein
MAHGAPATVLRWRSIVMCHPQTTVSQRKIEANRRNALRSTGPRTDQGKARSSRNATTHGVFCREMVLPDEDPREFDRYRIPMMRGLEPRDGLEQELAEQIVSLGWKLRRLRRVEGEIISQRMNASDDAPEGKSSVSVLAEMFMGDDPALERLAKHERRMQSTMNQLIGRLRQIQKMRQHGILHDHADKLINFEDPEAIGEPMRDENEPTEDGSDPKAEVYEQWETIEPELPEDPADQYEAPRVVEGIEDYEEGAPIHAATA